MRISFFEESGVKTRMISGDNGHWRIKNDILEMDTERMNIDIINLTDGTFEVELKGKYINLLADNIEQLYTECEGYKETIEVLQRQFEKERAKNAVKSELEQNKEEPKGVDNDRDALDARTYSVPTIVERTDNTNPDPELYTAMKILIARHNETLMDNKRLRKRNDKLKQDFESIKGHLRVAQHKLDEYGREKHYSEIRIDSYSGQRLTFKDAKTSTNSNGEVTVIGESVNNLIERLKQLCETEKKFKEWQSIALKNLEGYENPKEN